MRSKGNVSTWQDSCRCLDNEAASLESLQREHPVSRFNWSNFSESLPLEEHLRSLGLGSSAPSSSTSNCSNGGQIHIQVFPGSEASKEIRGFDAFKDALDILISHLTGKQHLKKVRQLAQ